ncbi:MAG: sigma-70 family RNA polymerase sigma factor [Bdellovibrionales bacterium]|nr:sigma-70 family RNA polymerase sigma factor [Bdellovibrionales bacterium]
MSKKKKKIKNRVEKVSSTSPVLSPEVLPSISEGGNFLQNYMAHISKIPVLSKEEEYKLTVDYYETRDPEIAKKIIQSNLRFVVKVVSEYSKFSSKVMDLIQEGNIGLIKAVKEFNPYKGARLITYAVWWIRGYIQEYLIRQHSIVRLGTNKKQQRLFYLLQKEKQLLEDYSKQKLLIGLAKQTGHKLDTIEQMKEIVLKKDLSLDQPLKKEGAGTSFLDLQSVDMSLDEKISSKQQSQLLKKHIKKMEKEFNEKEKSILKNRFLKSPPHTLQQIADEFGISREAVRQSEERLMKKLRKKLVPILKKPY